MDLKALRDELVLQKGAYNEAVKNNKLAVDELLTVTKSFSTDEIALMKEMGIDTNKLFNFDIEALTTNKDYLDDFRGFIQEAAESLEISLTEALK